MSTLDEAIVVQENIAQQIKAIYDKFKKDGTAQKTYQYVSSRKEKPSGMSFTEFVAILMILGKLIQQFVIRD